MGRSTSEQQLGARRTNGLWAALAATGVVALCVATGALQWLEYRVYDAAVRITTPAPLGEITIVGLDDASRAAPREAHAQLIDRLAAAGAKTIVLASFFSAAPAAGGPPAEPAQPGTSAPTATDPDAHLAASIQRAGNVLLASRYGAAPGAPAAALPSDVRRSTLTESGLPGIAATSVQLPAAALSAAAAGIGHWATEPDEDGRVRQLPLVLHYDNAAIPSLALLAAMHSLRLGPADVRSQGGRPGLRLGGLHVAADARSILRPRFHAGRDGASPFPTTPLASVLGGQASPQGFRDKIVVVGEAGTASARPAGASATPDTELIAHAVSSLRLGLGVQRPIWAAWISWGAALGALLFVAAALPRLSRTAGWVASAAGLLALAGSQWSLLRGAGQWVPLEAAALALFAGTLVFGLLRMLGGMAAGSSAQSAEAAEAERMMGLVLHGQGRLDLAFERLRKLPPSDTLLDNLYHLAQDFERQRDFAKAKAAYKHILLQNREYRDARARYKRVRAKLKDQGGTASSLPPASVPSVPAAMPRLPGEPVAGMPMLGRYRIDREIGKGAMGVVYLGRDPRIGRAVAIKTLALGEEFEGGALLDARERFFREAEAAGRLQHPYIVTVFDAGEEHDLAYIAMEFLQGSDLAPACSAGHLLPVATVLAIAARVAEALDYAHAHQVVHRDIKPANIMFDRATDTVKVTDFGIARITDSSKTRTGLVLGTPSFMSPEQLAGKKVDGRSDLYSLGVTLFQLLTGELPLRGDSLPELMRKIATVDAPDIRQLRPELPPALAQVVARSLHKNPQARYQTGMQFATDLRQAMAGAAGADAMPGSKAVVYDAHRDAAGQAVADFQETVMEPTVEWSADSPPASAP